MNDSVYLAQFVSTQPALEEIDEEDVPDSHYYRVTDEDEQQSLYYVAGYIVRWVTCKYQICEACKLCLKGTGESENAWLCKLKCHPRGKKGQSLPRLTSAYFLL